MNHRFLKILFTLLAIGSPFCITESSLSEDVKQEEQEEKNYYVERRSYGTGKDTEPPKYVKSLDKTWVKNYADIDWLDVGIDYRFRYEYRNNDYRRSEETIDEPMLLRTRVYLALKERLDPFRATVEYEDSRRRNSQFEPDVRDINQNEPIQSFVELYFKEGIEKNRPFSLKFGRMAFEYLDRRLLARNEWRNTTNTFFGWRATLGKQENDWQLDFLALQPLERREEQLDKGVDAQWLYGAILDWRRWSEVMTIQPYYLDLRQDGDKVADTQPESARIDRAIHTIGLRGYGVFDESGLDYDYNLVRQFGDNGSEKQEAYAYIFETGYTAKNSWKPRASAQIGFASGDNDPNDGKNQRFERLFGFARPWSNNDYFQMENILTPKLRIEFTPYKDLRIDTGYSWYYLDSAKDRWQGGNLRDPSGQSGKDVGQEADIRVRYPLTNYLGANIGYAYFRAGDFTRNLSPDRDPYSHFFYTELTLTAFERAGI